MRLRRLWQMIWNFCAIIGIAGILGFMIIFYGAVKARVARRAETAIQSKVDDMKVQYFSIDTAQTCGQFLGKIRESYNNIQSVALARIGDSVDFSPSRAVIHMDLDSDKVALFFDYFTDCNCQKPPLVRISIIPDRKGVYVANGSLMRRIATDAYYDLGKRGSNKGDSDIALH